MERFNEMEINGILQIRMMKSNRPKRIKRLKRRKK